MRACNNPPPSQGGSACSGYNFQYCNTGSCDMNAGIFITMTFNYLRANLTGTNVYLLANQFTNEIVSVLLLDSTSDIDVVNIYMPGGSQTVIVFELNTHNGNEANQNNANTLNNFINNRGSTIYNTLKFPLLSTVEAPPPPSEKWYNNITKNPIFWVVLWGSVVLILVLVYCKFCYCAKRQSAKEERKDAEDLKKKLHPAARSRGS